MRIEHGLPITPIYPEKILTFRLTAEIVNGKCVLTLLEDYSGVGKDPTNTRPTIACQMGDTMEVALEKIFPYLLRECIRHEIERDIIEGRT